MLTSLTIICGGQTGVDRAALDFALDKDIPCEGWCPKGRLAEDGPVSLKYPLKETASPEYEERTRKNITDSDGTLVLHAREMDKGTAYTMEQCKLMKQPFIAIILKGTESDPGKLLTFLRDAGVRKLNIAGPRESNSPGIYSATRKFLEQLPV